jgi:hypothetical protein
LPEARERLCRGAGTLAIPSLEADAAVWVVSLSGSLTGRVGDFGFGLTKPVLDGARLSGAGFLVDENDDLEAAGFLSVSSLGAVAVCFFGTELIAFDVSFAGLFGALANPGDFIGLVVVLADIEIGAVFGADLLLLVVVVDVGFTFSFVCLLPFNPVVAAGRMPLPFAAVELVGLAVLGFVLVSSASTTLSEVGIGVTLGVCVLLLGGNFSGEACLGDSGMGSLTKFVLNATEFWAMTSVNMSFFSGAGVVFWVSLLNLRLETDTESPLGSRLRPIRPSFSMATKFVRTLDSGRGDSDGLGDPSD